MKITYGNKTIDVDESHKSIEIKFSQVDNANSYLEVCSDGTIIWHQGYESDEGTEEFELVSGGIIVI